jgi:hypothetical protein
VTFTQRVSKKTLRGALLACDAIDWAQLVRRMYEKWGGLGAVLSRGNVVWFRLPKSVVPVFDLDIKELDLDELRACAAEWNRIVDNFLAAHTPDFQLFPLEISAC